MEGILCLHDHRLKDLFDLKIFIHCDLDIALGRRILRDIAERGRDVNEVLNRYNKFVKPDFQQFVKPQMKLVDLIIPGGASNDIALQFVIENILTKISKNQGQPKSAKAEKFQRITRNRKLSVNTVDKIKPIQEEIESSLGKILMENHIPFSRELRNISKSFFPQIYSNPDAPMIKMNMKYLSELARVDILNAMSSDFQLPSEEVKELIVKVVVGAESQDLQLDSEKKRIYFIRKRSVLDLNLAKKILALIKKIDNLPVYLHVDFISSECLSLICKNSPNTHLFSLYYLESSKEFMSEVSPETLKLIL
jgi:hypothetical protein